MTVHLLKCESRYFRLVVRGIKTFEVRKKDRDYKVGDILVLSETVQEKHTGNCFMVEVKYILDESAYCLSGYVILGISPASDNMAQSLGFHKIFQRFDDDFLKTSCHEEL